jgi:DNA-binding beta-propeller fold protein YncE
MNRRTFLGAALAAPVAIGLDPMRVLGATTGGAVVALATADLESHVVALETASGRILKRIRTVEAPRSIESSPCGHVVVAHTPIGALSVLDAATLTVRAVVRGLGAPRYTAMHPAEKLAYVTDSGRGEVVTVDLDRARIVHRA